MDLKEKQKAKETKYIGHSLSLGMSQEYRNFRLRKMSAFAGDYWEN